MTKELPFKTKWRKNSILVNSTKWIFKTSQLFMPLTNVQSNWQRILRWKHLGNLQMKPKEKPATNNAEYVKKKKESFFTKFRNNSNDNIRHKSTDRILSKETCKILTRAKDGLKRISGVLNLSAPISIILKHKNSKVGTS